MFALGKSGNDFVYDLKSVSEGECVPKPMDPVKEGYVFVCWVTDDDSEWDFDTPLPAWSGVGIPSFSLYAQWEEEVLVAVDKSELAALIAQAESLYASNGNGYDFLAWLLFLSDYGDAMLGHGGNTPAPNVLNDVYATQEQVDNAVALLKKAIARLIPPVVAPDVFIVTFDTQGGSTIEPQEVEEGECAVQPEEGMRKDLCKRYSTW